MVSFVEVCVSIALVVLVVCGKQEGKFKGRGEELSSEKGIGG